MITAVVEKGSEPEVFRPAGLLERFHISRQLYGCNACVLVGAKFEQSSATNQAIRIDDFYRAVAHAIHAHPSLSINIHDPAEEKGVPVLARMPCIDLEQGIKFLNVDADQSNIALSLENALVEQFDGPDHHAPLWRFTVTSTNYVIFVYHHVLGDGQSGLAVLQSILRALNDSSSYDTPPERFIMPPAKMELLPSLENRIHCAPSLCTVCRAVLDEVLPGWTKSNVWTGNDVLLNLPPPPNRVRTRLRVITLSPVAASHLVERARSHKTTVTSVIHYTSVLVLSHLLNDSRHACTSKPDGPRYKRLQMHVAVSLRSQACIAPTQMYETASSIAQTECLVATNDLSFPCCGAGKDTADWSEGFPWPKAAQFSQVLKSCGPRARSELGLLKFVDGKFEGFWKGKFGKKRSSSVELSNVGVWSLPRDARDAKAVEDIVGATANADAAVGLPTDASWSVSTAFFAQDDNVVGTALKVNVIGSPNRELSICVTWGDGAVVDSFAEAFTKALGHALGQLGQQA